MNEINGLLPEKDKNCNALNYSLSKQISWVSEKSVQIEEQKTEIKEKGKVNARRKKTVEKGRFARTVN